MTGKEQVGRRIKLAREQAGLTQAELAARIGLGAGGQMISNYERGQTEPPPPRLRRIAEATHQPLAFFFSDGPAVTEPGEEETAPLLAQVLEHLGRLELEIQQLQRDIAALRRERDAGQAGNGS